jgi:hypothetical protein
VNHWWRAYNEAVNDPKLQLISDSLFRAWFNVMCIASANDGELPALKDLAFTLRLSPTKTAQVLAQLHAAGLLDKTETSFTPHNWGGRQYKTDKPDETAAERMRNYRERKRNAMSTDPSPLRVTDRNVTDDVTDRNTVTVTVPRLQTTDTDTEQKEDTREAALSSAEPRFEVFWSEWPNKVGKPAALKALKSAVKRAPFGEIMDGVASYIRDKPPDRPWLNPATFLNQNRWEDQPAQVAHGRIQETENLSAVARRHAEAGIAFGERPTTPSLCVISRGPDVRLLSQGGSERPGDLRSSDGCGLERIPAGGD